MTNPQHTRKNRAAATTVTRRTCGADEGIRQARCRRKWTRRIENERQRLAD